MRRPYLNSIGPNPPAPLPCRSCLAKGRGSKVEAFDERKDLDARIALHSTATRGCRPDPRHLLGRARATVSTASPEPEADTRRYPERDTAGHLHAGLHEEGARCSQGGQGSGL